MEIQQIKYFVALAHSEHLTNTAKEFMVTPSAIRISISRLESDLGVKLFDRVGRNIILNRYGQAYLPYAEAVLNNLEDGRTCIEDVAKTSATNLTLAVWMPQVWQGPILAFQRTHPEITVNQVTYDPVTSTINLARSGIDLIIASPDSFSDPNWAYTHLFDDKILLAVPPQHHLASRRSVDLRDLKDEYFITTTLDTFSKRCFEMCKEAGFTMKAPIKCDYTLRPEIMVNENLCCFITYHGSFTRNFSKTHLVEITYPSDVRPQNIYWKKSRYIPHHVQIARDFFVDYYKDFKVEL